MDYVYFTLFLFLISFSVYNTEKSKAAKSAIISRFFAFKETNQSLVIEVDETLRLKDPFNDSVVETNLLWYLYRGDDVVTIYENNTLDSAVADLVKCYPSENDCQTVIIKKFSKEFIGVFARVSNSKNTINIHHYFVSGYEPPLKLSCNSNKLTRCIYNETTNTLYVRADEEVTLECAASFYKFDKYDVDVEIDMNCLNENTPEDRRNKNPRTTGLFQFDVFQSCNKKFLKTDNKFACGLRYADDMKNIDEKNIDDLNVIVVVEHGPDTEEYTKDDTIKKVAKGKSTKLTCPFSGYPIKYYWKDLSKSSEEFLGEKEFTVNKPVPGKYSYECRAVVSDIEMTPSKTVAFQVEVTSSSLTKKNLYIIIGSVAGGVVLIAVIIVVIVALKKKGKKGSSKRNRGSGQSPEDDEGVKFRK